MAKKDPRRNGTPSQDEEEIASTEEQEIVPQQKRRVPPTTEEVQTHRARTMTVATRNLAASLGEALHAAELLDEQLIMSQQRMALLQKMFANQLAEKDKRIKELEAELAEVKGEPKEEATTDQPPSQQSESDRD